MRSFFVRDREPIRINVRGHFKKTFPKPSDLTVCRGYLTEGNLGKSYFGTKNAGGEPRRRPKTGIPRRRTIPLFLRDSARCARSDYRGNITKTLAETQRKPPNGIDKEGFIGAVFVSTEKPQIKKRSKGGGTVVLTIRIPWKP